MDVVKAAQGLAMVSLEAWLGTSSDDLAKTLIAKASELRPTFHIDPTENRPSYSRCKPSKTPMISNQQPEHIA